jgi:hypothetical protein
MEMVAMAPRQFKQVRDVVVIGGGHNGLTCAAEEFDADLPPNDAVPFRREVTALAPSWWNPRRPDDGTTT